MHQVTAESVSVVPEGETLRVIDLGLIDPYLFGIDIRVVCVVYRED